MKIEDVEAEINSYYRTMTARAVEVVGPLKAQEVKIVEHGRLEQLWALADHLYLEDAMTLPVEEIISEYGYTTLMEVTA